MFRGVFALRSSPRDPGDRVNGPGARPHLQRKWVPPIMAPGEDRANVANEVTPFANDEFSLDMIPDGDSFKVVAPALARTLGFREAYDLLRTIPDEERGSELVRTPGGSQRVLVLTEAGFYRALGQRQAARITDERQRAAVERFQTWVYHEVLPAIRKTGSYAPAPRELSRLELIELARESELARLAAEQKVAELAPSAQAWDTLATADGDYDVARAAQILSNDPEITIGRDRLFTYMSKIGWVYRGAGNRWCAYQTQIDAGRLMILPGSHYHPRTGELVLDVPQVRVTVKGVGELHKRLRPRSTSPQPR